MSSGNSVGGWGWGWLGQDAAGLGSVPDYPLLNNLVAYYSLEEASGTRVDSKGGNNLTDNNTVTQNTGKIANCAQFTAANVEYLNRADNAALSMGDIDFTLVAWVYLDTKAAPMWIWSKGDANTSIDTVAYSLSYQSGADRFRFTVGNGTASITLNATTIGSPATGTWYFIVAWYDATANTANIQVNDGAVDSTAYAGGSYDDTFEFTVGRPSNYNGEYWNGRIDELGIWKRILTATERPWLWNGSNGRSYADILAYMG